MSLAEQQNALLSAIFKSGEQTFTRDNERGLAIYQRNLLANAVRALSITYPGVNKLLGAEDFKRLCELYLQRLGKRQYDWGVWGAELPQLLLDFEQPVCDQLLLSELAVFEWFIHSIERSSDTDRDLATLSLLATDDSYNIKLNLAPGIQLYSSHFLLDSLKLQLDGESSNKLVELEYNGDNESEYLFVLWRPLYKASYLRIESWEYRWLSILMNTPSLGAAFDVANSEQTLVSQLSFTQWLSAAVEKGQLFSISTCDTH